MSKANRGRICNPPLRKPVAVGKMFGENCKIVLAKPVKLVLAKRASSLSDGLNEKSAVGWDEIQQ
ncbi:hypothetical protein LVJ85_12820 [Neisseria sp. Dent CA1/247]|uniref:hypothetical protein n=1 Tax=Neisseria sp. Dent CA1/247 TaxID=2912675 RepID=UPI001FD1B921|nr:hypothetical protein [Neisseria sp. Dent CA1/247]UOO76860.1 hypothetical protein LVJ85_12820 [Neisseria sp. Dent CA1/247]